MPEQQFFTTSGSMKPIKSTTWFRWWRRSTFFGIVPIGVGLVGEIIHLLPSPHVILGYDAHLVYLPLFTGGWIWTAFFGLAVRRERKWAALIADLEKSDAASVVEMDDHRKAKASGNKE